jgi:hypothetical protein
MRGGLEPASIIRQVVLPEPDGPSIVRNSPLGMVKVEIFDDERFAVIALLHAFERDESPETSITARAHCSGALRNRVEACPRA